MFFNIRLVYVNISVAIHGIEPFGVVPSLCPRVRPSIEEDFLRIHPKKNIWV